MDPTLSLSERTPEQIASEINSIKSRTDRIMLESCVEIGRRLTEVKDMIPYGKWGQWLKQKVSYSQITATRLMRVHKEFGPQLASEGESLSADFSTLKNLSFSKAVSLLGIPAEEREEFLAVHDVKNMSAREMQAVVQEKQSEEEEMPLVFRQVTKKRKKIPRKVVEVNDATQGASKKYDEQFARHCDNLLKEYRELLNILTAQSRIDTAGKEKNRQRIFEIAANMTQTTKEYPPKVTVSADVNMESF